MSLPVPIKVGVTESFALTITLPNGDPWDLTDYSVDFFVKRSLQDADSAALFHGTLSDGVAIAFTEADGIVNITIPKTATALMRRGRPYPWYILLVHTPTGAVKQPDAGTFLATFTDTAA